MFGVVRCVLEERNLEYLLVGLGLRLLDFFFWILCLSDFFRLNKEYSYKIFFFGENIFIFIIIVIFKFFL